MHLFTDYIQPTTDWLQMHPNWALALTFAISFAESLAIVGSIIPGSVTMTAIGILAGSGVMPVDLTLLFATLGAIAGDSVSYLLGYAFSDRLTNIWPFKRYPHWLNYGKDFFAKHGGKSVLIGRFVGPLRSIIPVIAGMMHMSHWHFYVANVLSAIAWSLLYVLPGVLIGAASNELSPESATRLFMLVLFLLGGIWLTSVILKWLLVTFNKFLKTHLHDFWSWSGKHPHLTRFFHYITPPSEKNYYATAGLILLFLLCTLLFAITVILTIQFNWITSINQPVLYVLQSIRTVDFDTFFIASSQLTSDLTLITTILVLALLTVYAREWRTLFYWFSLTFSCSLLLLLTHWLINSPRPLGLMNMQSGNSFPAIQLTYATALFSSLLFYINAYSELRFKHAINLMVPMVLLLSGFSALYLGDYWLIDVIGAYLCGISLCLVHWLFYRRRLVSTNPPLLLGVGLAVFLLLTSFLSFLLNYTEETRGHQPYFAQYVFTDQLWWNQKKPLLPLFRINRLGQPVSLLNIQYAGSVNRFEASLSAFGWQKQNQSLYKSLLKRLNGHLASQEMPLMAELYLNRKPVLVMTYKVKDGSPLLVLRLWRSNYHLKHHRQPIWIGSVQPRPGVKTTKNHSSSLPLNTALFYVRMALQEFMQREVPLSLRSSKEIPLNVEPTLLLIRELSPKELFNVSITLSHSSEQHH